jgi:glycosyltransferase involved in cell wall biosynthesis
MEDKVKSTILRIYPFIPPVLGGMEKHILRLSQEQRELGCQVIIAFNQGEVTAVSDIQVLADFNLRKIKPQVFRDLIFYLALMLKLHKMKVRVDTLHIHGDWSSFAFGKAVARLCDAKKLVASVHGRLRKGRWGGVYRSVLRNFDVVYCTGATEVAFLKKAGVNNARWQCSGIDLLFFAEPLNNLGSKRGLKVVSVGNLYPVKNTNFILDLAIKMPEISFSVIGSGPLLAKLIDRKEVENIKNISFLGQLSGKEVRDELYSADVFLSSSFFEGTPTALLEAMAAGLPVVTSASNDFSLLLENGVSGFVVGGFEVDDYVVRIREIMNNPQLWAAMSSNNKQVAAKYTWPNVSKKITNWTA